MRTTRHKKGATAALRRPGLLPTAGVALWVGLLFGVAGGVLPTAGPAAAAPVGASATDAAADHPAYPGLLIIESARDTTRNYVWIDTPELAQRSLVWPTGVLTVPEAMLLEEYGVSGLAIGYTTVLTGMSDGRQLLFAAGKHRIDTPLYLTDGNLSLYAASGEIIIESSRLLYRDTKSDTGGKDPRANYLFLTAIVLLTFILMVRARSRLRKD